MKAGVAAFARAAFVICAFAGGIYLVASKRGEIALALSQLDSGSAVLGLATSAAYVILSWLAWVAALKVITPGHTPADTARMFFVGQLGKYLPGGVWPFLGVAELGAARGLERRKTFASLALALLVSVATGAALALAVTPRVFGVVLSSAIVFPLLVVVLALGFMRPVRRLAGRLVGSELAGSPWPLAAGTALSAAAWLAAGAQIAVLSHGIAPGSAWSAIGAATGAYALAWVAGFLVMIAPAGFGAREAVLIGLLSNSMTLGQATTVALLSRVAMTAADVGAAAVALALSRRRAARAAS